MVFFRSALPLISLSVAGLLLCYSLSNSGANKSQPERVLRPQFDPKTVTIKKPSTLVIVLNTPKCGTGGLTETFVRSFKCIDGPPDDDVASYNCDGTTVLRSHISEATAVATRYHRKPNQKCLITTAIRSPLTWMPSLFVQTASGGRSALCDKNLTIENFISEYKAWIIEDAKKVRSYAKSVRPGLLAEFGATLTDVMETVRKNNGYSLLSNASPSSTYAGCELLFLSMEHNTYWPDIIPRIIPGVTHQKGVSRVDLCPNIADHYKAIQSYKLTEEERAIISNGDPDVAEYFNVYGL